MIKDKKVLGIIPARGGSKAIHMKNIKVLAGKPLIAWTIEEAQKSKYIDRLITSTDDEEIIKVSKDYDCEVPFIRPKILSGDETTGIEPVLHAINNLIEKFDFVCLMQPTSPLRNSKHIDECIEKCVLSDAFSCVSVSEVDSHPFWMYEITDDETIKPLFPDNSILRRQELPKIYVLNGAIYVAEISELMTTKKFISEKTLSYVMDKNKSIDIDNIEDFILAEILINNPSPF